MNKQEVIIACKKIFAKDNDPEAIVQFLHSLGFSKIESMMYMVESRIASLHDAKEIVHKSNSWAERREADEFFHESLHNAVDEVVKGDGEN